MRLPFFPIPQAGETVKSTLDRFEARAGQGFTANHARLVGPAAERSVETLCAAFPTYLKRLSETVPERHPYVNIDDLIACHTGFPYYTYFDDNTVRRDKGAQIAAGLSTVALSLGLASYGGQHWSIHPRFCIQCAIEAERELGFAYFYREHQLPAVFLCWKHCTPLVIGCQTCGLYPIRNRPLLMAGKCFCPDGVKPHLAMDHFLGTEEVLLWIARESAYMVQAKLSDRRNLIGALRSGMCGQAEFSYLGRLSAEKISTALEKQYGSALLSQLGWPAFIQGIPSRAWARLLAPSRDRRCPSTAILLLSRLICDSLFELEGLAKSPSPAATEVVIEKRHSQPSRVEIAHALKKCQRDIRLAARMCQVSRYRLLELCTDMAISIPLEKEVFASVGSEKLSSIKDAIEAGVSNSVVEKRFKIERKLLDLIKLSDPMLVTQRRGRVREEMRDRHRGEVLALIERNPGMTLIQVRRQLPSAYWFLNKYDRQWLIERVPRQTQSSGTKRRQDAMKEESDLRMSEAVHRAAHDLRNQGRRVSRFMILSVAGLGHRHRSNYKWGPKTTLALEQSIENDGQYFRRKGRMVILEEANRGRPVTLRYLGKKYPGLLGQARETLIDVLVELGVPVAGKLALEVKARTANR